MYTFVCCKTVNGGYLWVGRLWVLFVGYFFLVLFFDVLMQPDKSQVLKQNTPVGTVLYQLQKHLDFILFNHNNLEAIIFFSEDEIITC